MKLTTTSNKIREYKQAKKLLKFLTPNYSIRILFYNLCKFTNKLVIKAKVKTVFAIRSNDNHKYLDVNTKQMFTLASHHAKTFTFLYFHQVLSDGGNNSHRFEFKKRQLTFLLTMEILQPFLTPLLSGCKL